MRYLPFMLSAFTLVVGTPLAAQVKHHDDHAVPIIQPMSGDTAQMERFPQHGTTFESLCKETLQPKGNDQARSVQKCMRFRQRVLEMRAKNDPSSPQYKAGCPQRTTEVIYEHISKIVPTNKRSTVMISCGKRLSVEEKIAMLEKTRNHMATKDFADWEGLPGSGAQEKADVMASIDAQMAEYKAQLKNADQAAAPQNQTK